MVGSKKTNNIQWLREQIQRTSHHSLIYQSESKVIPFEGWQK